MTAEQGDALLLAAQILRDVGVYAALFFAFVAGYRQGRAGT